MPPTPPQKSTKAVKEQHARARKAAASNLRGSGYGIIDTRGGSVDLIGVRYSGALFVRVVLHEPTAEDGKAIRGLGLGAGCFGEIWRAYCRERGRFEFAVTRIPT